MANSKQFHQYDKDQQALLASRYVSNKRVFEAERIPFDEINPQAWVIKMRGAQAVFNPYKNSWVLSSPKLKTSGRSARDLIATLRRV